ncbi:hypothetical protein CDD83_1467 [Cordyceps sp. RAO-2017]|nr:hypothetical protein CDD83_1467 [Cordyceps sp. RAO-2017]
MQPPELTLIVAATRVMGIGAHGSMPWTGLRDEMRYFARVTSRPPPEAPPGTVNAVIMGRKTWDSIPAKFRPLKDRLNIVVTRAAPSLPPPSPSSSPLAEAVRAPSLDEALRYARARAGLGRVFVIGGAQIYAAALADPSARRVLLTRIGRAFDCDTFFPLDFENAGWARADDDQLRRWTGEQMEELQREEAGVPYEFQMWEKREPPP